MKQGASCALVLYNEILQTILVPRGAPQPGTSRLCAWYKVSKRREMDISTVAACFRLDLDSTGEVRQARLAYGGVAPTPVRARQTERALLLGKRWDEETVKEFLPVLAAEFTPISDLRGSAEYRRALITSLFEKFCFDSATQATQLASHESVGAPTFLSA